jgi:hypothetical protein
MTISPVTPGESPLPLGRRRLLGGGLTALFGAAFAGRAAAQPAPSGDAQLLDQFAVTQVIARERLARESHDYDTAAACFHPDGVVDVSWFSGTAAQFVDVGRKAAARGQAATSLKATYFDSLSPAVVTVNGDRAIADAACAVHSFAPLDGVEVHVTAYTRLLWRLAKVHGTWLIIGLRGLYIRDTLVPTDPNQTITIDPAKLATFRLSYHYLSYLTAEGGGPVRNDRAGVDKPETVTALRAADRRWLAGEPG